MTDVESIVLVMKNALRVAQSLTMGILVTLGSAKALLNHVRQKMIGIEKLALVVISIVVRQKAAVGFHLCLMIRVFLGAIIRRNNYHDNN